ncbi:MAG: SRPBCC family protein [Nitrospiraceae bacterium]|nr:SRPBCC family protein [Nitrospiraceae bacterium]
MVLRRKIELSCPPGAVWPFISDPRRIVLWNERMKTIVPVSPGPWAANSRFRMRYGIGEASSNFLCEILEYEEPVRMVIHLKGGDLPAHGYLQEIFELGEAQGRTLLKHEVGIYGGGRNLLSAALLFLSHHLPRSRGKKCLRRLKELAEGGGRPDSQ